MVLKETQTFRVYNPSSVWRKPWNGFLHGFPLSTVFSTMKKGYIPETSVFLSKPFLILCDIYLYINPSENIFKCHASPRNFPFTVHYWRSLQYERKLRFLPRGLRGCLYPNTPNKSCADIVKLGNYLGFIFGEGLLKQFTTSYLFLTS